MTQQLTWPNITLLYQKRNSIIQKMKEQRLSSPEVGLKRSHLISTPQTNNKQYLPSRYAQDRKHDKVIFHDILSSIENKIQVQMENGKNKEEPSNSNALRGKNQQAFYEQRNKTSQFKSRPLKRQKNDEIKFDEIFLSNKKEALEELKRRPPKEENIKQNLKEYQKLLNIDLIDQQVCKNMWLESSKPIQFKDYEHHVQFVQNQLLQQSAGQAFNDFYQNHISIDPPDTPTSNQQSNSPGFSYAPSVPSNYKFYKNANLKELLMRARAGMNSDDIQKEAHLAYFLGEVYSSKKMFVQALKFYRRFLGLAKSLQDIIGMSLGANRVAISYFNCCQTQKSIIFHNENLKLTNSDNCFVGFYNIGICYRKMKRFDEALEYFQSSFSWAQQRGQQQSQCISLGQIGLTLLQMQKYAQSVLNFQKSNEIAERLKKLQLKLHNYKYILRISSAYHIKSLDSIQKIVSEAFQCAKKVGSTAKQLDLLRCNIGIVKGMKEIQNIVSGDCSEEIQYL